MVAAISLGSIALFTSLYLHERHSNAKLGTAMDVVSNAGHLRS